METTAKYIVIEIRTGNRANRTTYNTIKAARRACDRLDLAYGAINFRPQSI